MGIRCARKGVGFKAPPVGCVMWLTRKPAALTQRARQFAVGATAPVAELSTRTITVAHVLHADMHPVSALNLAAIAGLVSASVHHPRQEFLDYFEFGAFLFAGQFLAPAKPTYISIGIRAAAWPSSGGTLGVRPVRHRAMLLPLVRFPQMVAVLDLGADTGAARRCGLFRPPSFAVMVAALISSRIITCFLWIE